MAPAVPCICRKYLAFNLTPVAGVAAKVSRMGSSAPPPTEPHCLQAPLPLPSVTGLPVVLSGNFMVLRGEGRKLFRAFPPASQSQNARASSPDVSSLSRGSEGSVTGRQIAESAPPKAPQSGAGTNPALEMLSSAWNQELMACLRDAYIELLFELQRIASSPGREDIASSTPSLSSLTMERFYSFWPKSKLLEGVSAGSLAQLGMGVCIHGAPGASFPAVHQGDARALIDFLIKPLYTRLAEMPLWSIHGGGLGRANDGVFLAPPGAERAGKPPPAAVADFLRAHYKVLAVPWELTPELEAAGVIVNELTPRMLRQLLRTPNLATPNLVVETRVRDAIGLVSCFVSGCHEHLRQLSGPQAVCLPC